MPSCSPPRTLVIVATYNEVENLPLLVEEIHRQLPDADVLVIDDGSPDGTGYWCDEHALRDPQFSVLHRPVKAGLGSATVLGFQRAIAQGYTLALTMDADFSHDPRYLRALRDRMDEGERPVDVAIGSRYTSGGGIEGWPRRRRWMSRAINAYARGWLGLSIRDCSGAYRCYRTSILARLELTRLRARGYGYLEEILWYLQRAGARMDEVPIVYVDRVRGRTKINLREALAAVANITWIGLRRPRRGADAKGTEA